MYLDYSLMIVYLIKVSKTLNRIVHSTYLNMILNSELKSFLKRNHTDKHGWFLEFAKARTTEALDRIVLRAQS